MKDRDKKIALAAVGCLLLAGSAAAVAPKVFGLRVTVEQLLKVGLNLKAERAGELVGFLNAAMREASITTKARAAAFLAQLFHESAELRYFQELADGTAYEGRKDLGNTQKGDGARYKGRGPIQLTGRANYRDAGQALGLDLEGNPTQAANPDVGFRVAAWYWRTRGLNELADKGDFLGITKKINGGTNGQADREKYHARALAALA